MATHNQVRLIGILRANPIVKNEGVTGLEKIHMVVRTCLNQEKMDGEYEEGALQDLVVYFDDRNSPLWDELLKKEKYDIVDIKGVANLLSVKKPSACPHCEAINIKNNATFFAIYPISCYHLESFKGANDMAMAEKTLVNRYMENSNQALVIGKLTRDPEGHKRGDVECCRYPISVERKYFIPTQGHLDPVDAPWVYSFGKQKDVDLEYLKKGAEVLVDGFIRTEVVTPTMVCSSCKKKYTYKDAITEIIPYRVEYLAGQYKKIDINPDSIDEE